LQVARTELRRPAATGWFAGSGARRHLAAWLGGGLTALALPPLHLWPALLGFALLLHLLRQVPRRRAAFALGWWFGFGYFLVGLYWVAIAFFSDAERFGALALPAVVLLCAGMALYPALATWLAMLHRWRSPSAAALALALAWIATEALRARLFGGFPWNLIGYAWSGSDAVSQLGALTGIYGLSLLAVALGALPVGLLEASGRRRWWPVAAGAALLALIWLGGMARLAGASVEEVAGVRLRLVQGNVPQEDKWRPEMRNYWFAHHLRLSGDDATGITHVVWPESASPYPLDRVDQARALIAQVVPPGGLLLTGGERFDSSQDPPKAWNSLFVVDETGTLRAHYDKRDLVPFGEFMPLRDLLGRVGLSSLARGGLDFQAGPGRTTIALPGLPPFSPLICYETIFSGRVFAPGARPDWLLNVTNDGWFGQSSGPYQHLAMARMRAIEEGLPLVRSANTGISAVVDPWGRVQARLALGQTGVLDAPLPKPLPATVFGRARYWPVLLAVCASLLAMVVIERRAARRDSDI
jgi:apolipoprotein N-acyltransferase